MPKLIPLKASSSTRLVPLAERAGQIASSSGRLTGTGTWSSNAPSTTNLPRSSSTVTKGSARVVARSRSTTTSNGGVKHSTTTSVSPKPWHPHDYQRNALKFLLERQYGGLFSDPGTGKTAIILHLFAILLKGRRAKRMLVVVKNRTLHTTWPDEIGKWGLPLRHVILHGSKKDKLLRTEFDVALINYEGLQWLSRQKGIDKMFEVLVCDESSQLKEVRTQRFKTLKGMLHWFVRRYIITGTPASESLMNLFGQIYVLDTGQTFSPYITHFRNTYFRPAGYMGYEWVLQPGAEERIFDAVAPLVLRIPRDVLPLPPLGIVDRFVELPKDARDIYDDMERQFIALWEEGAVTAANAAVATGKLRQIANGAVYDEHHVAHLVHEEKVGEMADLVEGLEGKSVFVLYEYQHDLEAIRRAFPGAAYIGQGVSPAAAREHIRGFNAGEVKILAGQTQSVAHGLNLQADSHNVIFFSLPWSLENYIQAIARVWRQGQKNAVTVYRILARGTVDEDVADALERKDRTQSALLDAMAERYGRRHREKD